MSNKNADIDRKRRGRPPSFDRDRACEALMLAFWRDGYSGASVNEIAQASGASKPTIYDAFGASGGGGKDALYATAIEAYYRRWGEAAEVALDGNGALVETLTDWFDVAIERLTDAALPDGCLIVDAVMECDRLGPNARQTLSALAERSSAALRRRLKRARDDGELRLTVEPAMTFLGSQQAALAMLSAAGADRRTLRRTARIAIDAVTTGQPS